MNSPIDAAFDRSRSVVLLFLLLVVLGASAYLAIPKESEPDVPIPLIHISIRYEGISPGDAERLLIRPMEQELQALEGLKEIQANAREGSASLLLEFEAGFDAATALQNVRERVDIAGAELPPGTDEPRVEEITVALFPVLSIALSGPVPERTLVTLASRAAERIEALPGVLEVEIRGDREELVEVVVDPLAMESYGLGFEEVTSLVQRNHLLVPAGAIDTGAGRLTVTVPGLIEDVQEVFTLPVKVVGDTVVTFAEVAEVRRTYKDPVGFARVAGQPGVILEVSRRVGANIIETVEQVRAVVEEMNAGWHEAMQVDLLQDRSEDVRIVLNDLQNNVAFAVLLVMIVIVAVLGFRPGVLVGLAIPGAFLSGILAIFVMGFTLNIVVLFSLILVVGMLVDGSIVVVELAERRLAEGETPARAYAYAAKRMAWPIIAATVTTLAVFLPLLFWPGIVGEFMKYLPITVLVTLGASLAMALLFIPVLGALFAGRRAAVDERQRRRLEAAERGDLDDIDGLTGRYLHLLRRLLRYPGRVLAVVLVFIIATYIAYGVLGRGVQFFPPIEPEAAQVQIHARGDLSVWEQDALVRAVEERLLDMPEFKTLYSRSGGGEAGIFGRAAEDRVGTLLIEFIDWERRRPATQILEEVRARTADLPGLVIETRELQPGPTPDRPVEIELASREPERLAPAVAVVRETMRRVGGFVDVEDTRPLPGIEWALRVDREAAARYGADVSLLGSAVQLLTGGVWIAEYRPDDADQEVEIRLRFPSDRRSLDQLMQLRVPTRRGQVPIGNFVSFQAVPRTGTLNRVDARRVLSVRADVAEGLLVSDRTALLQEALAQVDLPGVELRFRGELEEQEAAARFLTNAFLIAISLMALFLVTQFNSIYQAVLVLSAVVLSTAGVLLGLLVSMQPFGIVMSGMGIIALAGIVVNNNIILIDTYNEMRSRGFETEEAILRTAALRLRPVLLTAFTTVLGLTPMVFGLNIDLLGRQVSVGAPSTQWWTQLATSIAGGLTFATLLTLLLTPCLLLLGANTANRYFALRRRWG